MEVVPNQGWPAGLKFDGRVVFLWWGQDADDPDVPTDLEPAQEWLRGKRAALDIQAGLDLWNWAGDAAYSTGQPWHDGGAVRDRCYDKLFAAAVPWVYRMESYTPTWTPRQVRAVHVLRAALPD